MTKFLNHWDFKSRNLTDLEGSKLMTINFSQVQRVNKLWQYVLKQRLCALISFHLKSTICKMFMLWKWCYLLSNLCAQEATTYSRCLGSYSDSLGQIEWLVPTMLFVSSALKCKNTAANNTTLICYCILYNLLHK